MNLRWAVVYPILGLAFSLKAVYAEETKKAGELEDVVIKGEENVKPSLGRPLLQINFDPFETLRDSLNADESLLLAEHPQAFALRKTFPEILHHSRVILPLGLYIEEYPSIRFPVGEKFRETLGKDLNPKDAKLCAWAFTIADEQGKVFQRFEGKGAPPEEILWNGRNEQKEKLLAGHAYSAVYTFTDPKAQAHTAVGKSVKFKGIVHADDAQAALSLDAAALFGEDRKSKRLEAEGRELLSASADWLKRRHSGSPLRIRSYAQDAALGEAQAQQIKEFLVAQLLCVPQAVSIESFAAPSLTQRVDLELLNK